MPTRSQATAEAPPEKKRRSRRREEILTVAARLFRERGYHDVGIDDIGMAAGITGPGVYRHFSSKQDVLAAVIWHAANEILAEAEQVIETGTPHERLEHLVENLVNNSIANRELMPVYVQERRHVSEADQDRLRQAHLRYIHDWTSVLRSVRPELTEAEARVHVEGVIWMVNSVAFYQPKGDIGSLKARLREMALVACLARSTPDQSAKGDGNRRKFALRRPAGARS